MADAFQFQVSNAIKTLIEGMTILGETPTVEYQRRTNIINGRYPYVMLIGPLLNLDPEVANISNADTLLVIRTYIDYEDEEESKEPITYYTRNVNRDIIVELFQDETLGGLTEEIDILSSVPVFEIVDEDNEEFYVEIALTYKNTVDNKTLQLFE